MHPNKLKNILNHSPEDRYGYLIQRAADFEEVWLIHDNGQYVMFGDNEENTILPVWPEKEFAQLMLIDSWKEYQIESKEIHDFIEWLDQLEKENYKIAGFPSPEIKAVVVSADERKNHLLYELQQYE